MKEVNAGNPREMADMIQQTICLALLHALSHGHNLIAISCPERTITTSGSPIGMIDVIRDDPIASKVPALSQLSLLRDLVHRLRWLVDLRLNERGTGAFQLRIGERLVPVSVEVTGDEPNPTAILSMAEVEGARWAAADALNKLLERTEPVYHVAQGDSWLVRLLIALAGAAGGFLVCRLLR